MTQDWDCPFCNRVATLGDQNIAKSSFEFDNGNKDGRLYFEVEAITCPNPKCNEYTLDAVLKTTEGGESIWVPGDQLARWRLRPQSEARVFPSYIPATILADYTEACLIRDLSPKASATLSRRCLQGIIRDFWGVSKDTLAAEINAIKDKLDLDSWQAIDAVRKIGNIGAHMEKDINLVIDVEPGEAQMLIGLIEALFKEWYVARHQRNANFAGLTALAKAKAAQKAAGAAEKQL